MPTANEDARVEGADVAPAQKFSTISLKQANTATPRPRALSLGSRSAAREGKSSLYEVQELGVVYMLRLPGGIGVVME